MLKLKSNSWFCTLNVVWWKGWGNDQKTTLVITTQQDISCQQLGENVITIDFLWEREFNWFVECVKQLDNQWVKQPLIKRLLVKLNLYLTKLINDWN
jgi:hypothetical protein